RKNNQLDIVVNLASIDGETDVSAVVGCYPSRRLNATVSQKQLLATAFSGFGGSKILARAACYAAYSVTPPCMHVLRGLKPMEVTQRAFKDRIPLIRTRAAGVESRQHRTRIPSIKTAEIPKQTVWQQSPTKRPEPVFGIRKGHRNPWHQVFL